MTFQFTCPQGHLLQAELNQAGQRSTCPHCATLMLIPQPPPAAIPLDAVEGSTISPSSAPASWPNPVAAADDPLPVIRTGSAIPPVDQFPDPTVAPEIYHIPCPQGHPLETPVDMIGQFAMCPQCNAQFELLAENSVEYRRRRQAERESREAQLDRSWLNWAIAIVVLVGLGLATLVVASLFDR